jgi:transcriptional regulator with XRE-family HTH domain
MSLQDLGEFVKAMRKEKRLTQAQLAEKITLDKAYIVRLEQGKQAGSPNSLASVARALGLAPSVLFDKLGAYPAYGTVDEGYSELTPLNSVPLPPILVGNYIEIEEIKKYIDFRAAQVLERYNRGETIIKGKPPKPLLDDEDFIQSRIPTGQLAPLSKPVHDLPGPRDIPPRAVGQEDVENPPENEDKDEEDKPGKPDVA